MGNAQRQWDIGYWAVKYMVALNQNHTVPAVHETGAMLCTKEDLVKWGILKSRTGRGCRRPSHRVTAAFYRRFR
jgi:hypothetical protein